jgi:hypothetical protein
MRVTMLALLLLFAMEEGVCTHAEIFVIYICLNPDVPPLSNAGMPTTPHLIRPTSSCVSRCRHVSSGCSSVLTAGGCSLICKGCTMCLSRYEQSALKSLHNPLAQ